MEMKACLFPLAKVRVSDGKNYLDTKNYNAIVRYAGYFEKLIVYCKVDRSKNPRYELHDWQLPENVEIRELSYDTKFYNPIRVARVYRDIVRSMANEVDLFMSWLMPEIIYIAPTVRKCNVKFYVYCGADYYSGWKNSDSMIKKSLIHFIHGKMKKAVYHADYAHYVTDRVLQEVYPTKGKSIGASYVNIKLDCIDEELKMRKSKDSDSEKNVSVGLVGHLSYYKGIDTAIKAMALLPKQFNLHILGGGNPDKYAQLAEKYQVSDRVHFCGKVEPGEPVREWVRNMDICIQPSRQEGLPRSVIEAMSLCVPVVGSRVDGIIELVKEGYLHEVGDEKGLAQKILLAEENKEELTEYSYMVAQRYDRKKLDDRINNFFEGIKKDIERGR